LGGGFAGGVSGSVMSDDPVSGAVTGAAMGSLMPLAPAAARGIEEYAIRPMARGSYALAEPFVSGGKQAIVNRTMREAFGNDEAAMQQALAYLDQGMSLEDIAVAMNKPVLAGFKAQAKNVKSGEIAEAYSNQRAARDLNIMNQLQGAQHMGLRAADAARQARRADDSGC